MKQFCLDCKYWRRNTEPYENCNYGECKCEMFFYKEAFNLIDYPVGGLGYYDYEGYSAGFETSKFFGCIHYAAKD